MKIMCITTTALALTATPAISGVCPEGFMGSLSRVMAAAAMNEVEGTITNVAADWSRFSLRQSDEQVVEIMVDKETVFTLDGDVVGRDLALASGRQAKVTHKDNLASRVDVFTEK